LKNKELQFEKQIHTSVDHKRKYFADFSPIYKHLLQGVKVLSILLLVNTFQRGRIYLLWYLRRPGSRLFGKIQLATTKKRQVNILFVTH